MPGEALQRLVVIGALRAGPGGDGALGQRRPVVGHDQGRIEEALHAQPVAGRAGAVRRVEAEQPRFDLLDGEAADRAGEARGEHGAFAAIGVLGIDDAVGHAERGFEAVGQARGDAVADDQAVHDGLDLVLDLAVERRDLADFVEVAVHLDAGEAAALQFGEFLAVFALAVAHDRGEQQQARALRHRHDAVDHLADTVCASIGRPVAGE